MDGLFFSAARNSSYFLSRARFQREKLCDMHFEHDVAYLRHVHRATRFRYQRRFLLFHTFSHFHFFDLFSFLPFSFHFFLLYLFIYFFTSMFPSFLSSFLPLFSLLLFHCFDIFFISFRKETLRFLFLFYFSFVISVLFSFSFFLFFISFDVSSRQGHSSFSRALGLPLIRHVSNSRNVVTHE